MKPFDIVRRAAELGLLKGLTPVDRLVFAEIAERAGSTGRSWESASAISKRWGYHLWTVRRSMERIEALGIVNATERQGQSTLWDFTGHPDYGPDPAPMSAGSTAEPRADERGVEPASSPQPRADERGVDYPQPRAVPREPRAVPRGTPRSSARRTYEPKEPSAGAARKAAAGRTIAGVWHPDICRCRECAQLLEHDTGGTWISGRGYVDDDELKRAAS